MKSSHQNSNINENMILQSSRFPIILFPENREFNVKLLPIQFNISYDGNPMTSNFIEDEGKLQLFMFLVLTNVKISDINQYNS